MDSNSSDVALLNLLFSANLAVLYILVAIFVCYKRQKSYGNLCRQCAPFVLRWAVYQVLASFALAVADACQLYLHYQHSNYGLLCTIFRCVVLYLRWVNLCLVISVSFHLFSYAVRENSLSKHEIVFIVISLFPVPIIPTVVLFSKYSGEFCGYFQNDTQNIAILKDEFYFWIAPSTFFVLAVSVAMILVMRRMRNLANEIHSRPNTNIFWNGLKEHIPLASFPIIFIVFQIIVFISNIPGLWFVNMADFATSLSSTIILILCSILNLCIGISLSYNCCKLPAAG